MDDESLIVPVGRVVSFSRTVPLLFLLIIVAGCAHTAFSELDQESQDDWLICHNVIAKAQCGETIPEGVAHSAASGSGIPIPIGLMMGMRPLLDEYATTFPRSKRQKWLVRHGCPSEMVEAGE